MREQVTIYLFYALCVTLTIYVIVYLVTGGL